MACFKLFKFNEENYTADCFYSVLITLNYGDDKYKNLIKRMKNDGEKIAIINFTARPRYIIKGPVSVGFPAGKCSGRCSFCVSFLFGRDHKIGEAINRRNEKATQNVLKETRYYFNKTG